MHCSCQEEATGRPIHVLSEEEGFAAAALLQLLRQHLAAMCGDLRLHTITNVGLQKKTGMLLKDSLIESHPARDRSFFKLFLETQMFATFSDAMINRFCGEE